MKVADFGLAKQFSYAASNFNYKSGGGTWSYMAPERLDFVFFLERLEKTQIGSHPTPDLPNEFREFNRILQR